MDVNNDSHSYNYSWLVLCSCGDLSWCDLFCGCCMYGCGLKFFDLFPPVGSFQLKFCLFPVPLLYFFTRPTPCHASHSSPLSWHTPLHSSLHCSKPPPPLLLPGTTATPEKLYYLKKIQSTPIHVTTTKTSHTKTGHHMSTKPTTNSYSYDDHY